LVVPRSLSLELAGTRVSALEVLIGSAIAVVTWPIADAPVKIGIDTSWIVGLHLAVRQGLQFGQDIAFTFGPLGFLGWPEPYVAWTSAAALAFVALIHLTACLTFVHLVRQSVGLPVATVLVLMVAFTFPWIAGWRLLGILVFVAVAAALYRRSTRPSGLPLAVGLGVVIGIAALGKLNIAAVALAIATIGVVATARRPGMSLAAFLSSGVLAFVASWLLAGQHLGDVPAYVRTATDIATGYGESMGVDDPSTSWSSGVALLSTFILAALIWQRTSTMPRRERLALRGITALVLFAEYKAGFTRAGVGVAIYLATLLALWPVAVPPTRSWAVASVPVAGLFATFLAVLAIPITTLIDPVGRVVGLGSQADAVLFHRAETAAATAASFRAQYDLPSAALAEVAGRTVQIEPFETAAAYAYPQFDWSPAPVIQAYSAYTPGLDHLNAARLAGLEAPERVLWITPPGQPLAIDGRSLWFEAPAAKIEMVCRYVPLAIGSDWQVLGRVANRCGASVPVATVQARAGHPTSVPAGLGEGIVTVRISGVASDPLSRLQILAYRGSTWTVDDGRTTARIPLGTASEPNVIGATGPIGYCGPLKLAPAPATITVGPAPGAPGTDAPLTLEFAVIPVTPTAATHPCP